MARIYLNIFLWLFFTFLAQAQKDNIYFDNLTTKNGLSSNNIYSILQDSKGFMWFATGNGLNRYDGYNFINYSSTPGDSNYISNNIVFSLYEDRYGNYWIGTADGLNLFDHTTEKFLCFFQDSTNSNSLPNNHVNHIMQDRDGNLWIGTDDGLAFLSDSILANIKNIKNPRFEIYKYDSKNDESISSNNIKYIFEDRKGTIWISAWCYGINRFDKQNKQFKRYTRTESVYKTLWQTKRFKNLPSVCINTIYQNPADEDNIIWLGSNNELIKFNTEREIFTAYYPKPKNPDSKSRIHITSLFRTSNDLFILGTDGHGLNIFDKNKERFYKLKKEANNPNSISSNIILTIYEDKSGIIWLGTSGGGVSRFNTKKKKFYRHLNNNEQKNNLANIAVNSIFEDLDDGYLWIGTDCSGLIRYNTNTGNYTNYNIDSLKGPWQEKLACYPIVSIFQNSNNKENIWLAVKAKGLVKYNKKQNKFCGYNLLSPYNNFYKRGKDTKNLFSTTYPSCLVCDKKENLWLAALGLYEYNPKLEKFRAFKHDPNNSNSIVRDKLTCLLFDQNNELWIGTGGGGLDRYNPETNQFTHYKSDPSNLSTISNNTIRCLYQDNSGVLWIGTSMGLNKLVLREAEGYNRKNGTFRKFYEKDGLPSNSVVGILEDKEGNLWLSTDKGLSKFNIENQTFRNYDIYDGLTNNKFNTRACFKSKKGELFFGGPNGFISFFPDSIKDNLNIPPIVITDFQLFNKTVKPGKNSPFTATISETNEIVLNYDQSVFSFEFTALDYAAPTKNQYAYKMDGVDPDWVITDASRRFATYTQLDPGEYIFRVKGSNNDGVWNEDGTSVKIIITPPWWRTNFAYAFYIIYIGFIVWLTWRFQINRLKIRHELEIEHLHAEKLEEVDHLKSHFFANISHEFRTPLTLILGPVKQMFSGEFKGNFKEQFKIIIRNAERLLNLINQLLDLSKLESGKSELQAQATDIVSLTNGLVQAFESLAVRKEITLKFKTEIESQEVYIDKDKFEKIINNLLSNAFKFTPDGGVVEVALSTGPTPNPSREGNSINPLLGGDIGVGKDMVQITVSNTGPGIPTNQIKHIFDRFYQANNSYRKDAEGTGIGLALTRELVELHHGVISVESENFVEQSQNLQPPKSPFDKGNLKTTFTILLPLGKEHLKKEEIDFPLKKGARGLSKTPDDITEVDGKKEKAEKLKPKLKDHPTILIVEDNADLRQYIRRSMEKNYHIIEAEDGEEGLVKAIKEIPDLIISDVMMPEMDGFELCKKLKTDEKTSHIPVILLTARAAKEDKIQGLETGADDFIPKPFDSDELKIRIKNLIIQRKNLREQFSKESSLVFDQITHTSADEKFVKRILDIISENISDSNFNLESLSSEICLSRMQLHRKIQGLFGQSPGDFVRTIRLKQAAELLKNKTGNISEIAYEVGFENPANFSTSFRHQFGLSPSEYSQSLQ